jgi:hypothetical protein
MPFLPHLLPGSSTSAPVPSSGRVFVAPYNDRAAPLAVFLRRQGIPIAGFVDSFKRVPGVVHPMEVQPRDTVFINSPNHFDKISAGIVGHSVAATSVMGRYFFWRSPHSSSRSIAHAHWLNSQWYKLVKKSYRNNLLSRTSPNGSVGTLKRLPTNLSTIVIVGNGPSLRLTDLELLSEFPSVASNKIFLSFEETKWRPTFYVIEDPLDLAEYGDSLAQYGIGLALAPVRALKVGELASNLTYFNTQDSADYSSVEFSPCPLAGFWGGESVSYSMIQLAVRLGAKKIILTGFDHHYEVPKEYTAGQYIKEQPDSPRNHFHPEYRRPGDLWTEPRIENITQQFQYIKAYCESHNIAVINATRGGALEVFPRVAVDDLLGA